jgi:hypothetical protein
MAWEWVAPVATATAGVVAGGIGIFFTWLTGKQARDDARAAARETREQHRLENAYVDLLDMAERAGQWVQIPRRGKPQISSSRSSPVWPYFGRCRAPPVPQLLSHPAIVPCLSLAGLGAVLAVGESCELGAAHDADAIIMHIEGWGRACRV